MTMNTITNSLRVALLYNLKHPATLSPDAPPDTLADYDTMETVQAVEVALRNAGHQVIPLEADHTLLDSIRQVNPDICFNMARGEEGPYRESRIPALLDMLDIPYTGSDVLTLALTHDKAALKRAWRECELPTAPFQVFRTGDEELDPFLGSFPLFVKPLFGKSGMGIHVDSIVHNITQLRTQVRRISRFYNQPALVEEYLPGREFVVGIIGNPSAMKRATNWSRFCEINGYHLYPVLEVDVSHDMDTEGVNTSTRSLLTNPAGVPFYFSRANILLSLEAELTSLAIAAFEAVNAVDIACIDFKLDADGAPNLLTINTLPSLDPQWGSLAQMAMVEDVPFDNVIKKILDLALERHSLTSIPTKPLSRVSLSDPCSGIFCFNNQPLLAD